MPQHLVGPPRKRLRGAPILGGHHRGNHHQPPRRHAQEHPRHEHDHVCGGAGLPSHQHQNRDEHRHRREHRQCGHRDRSSGPPPCHAKPTTAPPPPPPHTTTRPPAQPPRWRSPPRRALWYPVGSTGNGCLLRNLLGSRWSEPLRHTTVDQGKPPLAQSRCAAVQVGDTTTASNLRVIYPKVRANVGVRLACWLIRSGGVQPTGQLTACEG